ncbi:hypothetical protein ACFPPD_01280 [Cohnella suwonensis]|uniref:Glycosyl hydrolase family 4 C-terminal domain-containing protein n=1 Tax=Cohnella suwonensis TaxID=696072 RepID=A0ABW0LN54_9BACL
MKVVLIGGGSFVFAPTVLKDAIVKHRLKGTLVLVDTNLEAAQAMAGAGSRIANELGVKLEITATVDREQALTGADFVIVSASVQGAKRWRMDYEILKEAGMADQARECGGLGGLLNSFRSITLLLDICRDMERLCPNAMLLDVTNPMPRVVTAIERFSSIRSVGFCNIAYRGPDGYDMLAHLLRRPANELEVVTGGLNHFSWVLSVKDKSTGEDLLPTLKSYIERGDWSDETEENRRELGIMREWFHSYGAVAAGAVDHHAEYLPFHPDVHYPITPPYHGTENERMQWLLNLKDIAAGRCGWQDLFNHGSWEHPIDLAVLLDGGQKDHIDILNVRNEDGIPQLPSDRVVEVPVRVAGGRLEPVILPAFPERLASLLCVVSDVHEFAAAAAATGDIELARKAIFVDPAITDKEAGYSALERMLAAHADLLPQFTRKTGGGIGNAEKRIGG